MVNLAKRRLVGGVVATLLVAVGIAAVAGILASRSGSDASSDAAEPGRCEDPDRARTISRQVRLTTAEEWIEFELWSVEPFPARALYPVVRIGIHDFSRSRYGDDGRLNTLVFLIPVEEFELLSADDRVWVYYGGAGAPPLDFVPDDTSPWSFGRFRKDLLDCPSTRDA